MRVSWTACALMPPHSPRTCLSVLAITGEEEEVGLEGWQELPDAYAFLYAGEAAGSQPLILKCLVAGDLMLVHAASLGGTCADLSTSRCQLFALIPSGTIQLCSGPDLPPWLPSLNLWKCSADRTILLCPLSSCCDGVTMRLSSKTLSNGTPPSPQQPL